VQETPEALTERIAVLGRELAEAREQQAAAGDVLKVISRSAFDLEAVLQTLIATALRLCKATQGIIFLRDGPVFRAEAIAGAPPDLVRFLHDNPLRAGRGSVAARVALSGAVEQVPDVLADAEYALPALREFTATRALIGVPLLRDGGVEGIFVLGRDDPGAFAQDQMDVVQSFADKAVIAIENGRLFEQLQARTREVEEALQQQTATADVLKVISRSAFGLPTVLQTLIDSAVRLCAADGVIYLRRGDVFVAEAAFNGPTSVPAHRRAPRQVDRSSVTGRVALSGSVEQIPDNLADPAFAVPRDQRLRNIRALLGVPLLRDGKVEGVFVLGRSEPGLFTERQVELVRTFADQAVIAIENVRLFEEVKARTDELARSLEELRTAQDRLIQTEKLASLGQLTAGIAHEIKNPLNFINNFADLSRDLLDELSGVIGAAGADLPQAARDEVTELTGMIKSNLEKVAQHGRRADSIVKNMLLHSREGGGERRDVDLNAVVEESLNLAYHGARAEKPGFNITLAKDLDPAAGRINLYPQEFTRVLLNLISNGFYAAHRKKTDGVVDAYEPTLSVATRALADHVEIRIRDNGTGIPDAVRAKMFNPFFTTKPAGEGTGLGLSLSHDIIVKQHGGAIDVETKLGEFTEFTIALPRPAPAGASPGGKP
jgi:two-component system NtrC family sensor kinase